MKIGVYVCECGINIAATVDVEKVVEEIGRYPGVVHAENYMYMCSDPGQEVVRKAIREKNLDAIVNANCSPSLHERTFRRLAASEGINPYRVEIANIREHCSWPHAGEKEIATKKALAIIKATIERLRLNMALTPAVIPLTKRAMVIGGGVAGMQAALDIANGGYEVVLVEKSSSIGGHAAQLSGTFPTLERPPCLIAPMMAEIAAHPKIALYTCAEVEEVSGYVGNLVVKIRKKARFVSEERCDYCGLCIDRCPVSVPSEFDRGLSERKAIYVLFDQAVPQLPVIDAQACLHFKGDSCRVCEEICPTKAIEFSQVDDLIEEEVGAIAVASDMTFFPGRGFLNMP